jgi:tripartite ATP-independent transporter DctM subunit
MRKFLDGYAGCSTGCWARASPSWSIPVTLQMIARQTGLIPNWIWTEEMARFFFIWMVMLGAMIGVREGTHFDVDVWPELKPRTNAVLRIVSMVFVLLFALDLRLVRLPFPAVRLEPDSELADLPMGFIFAAWPLTGLTWFLFGFHRLRRDSQDRDRRPGPGDHRRAQIGTGAWLSPPETRCARLPRGGVAPALRHHGEHRHAHAGVAALWLFGSFFLLMVLRVPVAFALGLACLPVLFIEPRLSPMVIFNTTFKAYNSFILLAVPFFLLTANLMNVGGITDRLVTLSRTMVGNFPGRLAQINVLLSVFFAGISGSSTADAASQGKIFIEAQVKEGYDLSFSIAITAVSAVLAVIIPPSILMVVWGGVLQVSIGALYLAGIIPGLLIGLAQMATVHVYAKLPHYPTYPRATFKEFFTAAAISVPALFTPFIIVGGILLGWFTATESAAVAVLYAAVLSFFFYREMDGPKLWQALLETGKLSAIALFCVGTASVFGWLLAYYQIPKALLQNVTSWGLGPIGVGFFIVFVFLVVGCFLDAIPAIIIVGTVLQPLAASVNMHPVSFAIISIVALAFGLVTPPYGLCLMISCAIAKVRLRYALKDTLICWCRCCSCSPR